MPGTYTPSTTGALTLSYQQVSDGDKRKAASINPGLSTMSDDIAKLAVGKITTANPQRSYAHFEYSIDPATQNTHWVKNHSSTPVATTGWKQIAHGTADVNNDSALYLPFDPPHGATIGAWAFWISVPVGPHGALPSVMPRVVLQKRNIPTGVETTIANITDASASVGAYETVHSIAAFGGTEVVDRTVYEYQFVIFGESGTNALDNLVANGVDIIFTMSSIDQGAG